MSSPSAEEIPSPEQQADARRIERLLEGDVDALAEMRRWIRGAAAPYRSTLAEDLEDLEQEVVMSTVEVLRSGRFEGRSTLQTYVRRAMVYRCINRVRDRRRRRQVPVEEVEHDLVGSDGTAELEVREQARLALRIQASMPAHCRRMWSMVINGASYQDMSAQLDVRPGTLRVRLLRCRRAALEKWARLQGDHV